MSIHRLDGRKSGTRQQAEISGPLAPHNENEWTGRMYAIAFDLDTSALERFYSNPNWRNAYKDIACELKHHGFERQQGSVYFGKRGVDAVRCTLATQAVSKRFPWFAKVVRDIRMLRIEEHNDLMPAIGQLDLPMDQPGGSGNG